MTTEQWVPELPATLAAGGTILAAGSSAERRLAATSYLFPWITGIAVLGAAGRGQRFARWHAIQAVGLGVFAMLAALGLHALHVLALAAVSPYLATRDVPGYALPLLVGMMALAFIVALSLEALKGRTVRIPGFAALADRLA